MLVPTGPVVELNDVNDVTENVAVGVSDPWVAVIVYEP